MAQCSGVRAGVWFVASVILCLFLASSSANTVDHEDLASIPNGDVQAQFAENVTAGPGSLQDGWKKPTTCAGEFCIYTNPSLGNGRGIAVITTADEMENLWRIGHDISSNDEPLNVLAGSFSAKKDQPDGGIYYTADKAIRRGRSLMSLTPVLLVNQELFEETSTSDQTRLLESAVQALPEATRAKINRQRQAGGIDVTPKSVADVLREHPFQVVPLTIRTVLSENYYAHYPEAVGLSQDCRPNIAFHFSPDQNFVLRATVVRRIAPDERLTISHIDVLLPRKNRQEEGRRQWGHLCSCPSCTGGGGGDLAAMAQSDKRVEEIRTMVQDLEDVNTRTVTPEYVARYIDLCEKEGLQAELAQIYWRAAINFSYLGRKEEALKYTGRAIQAAMIQWGLESEAVVEMRIFQQDPLNHYSWRRRIILRGENEDTDDAKGSVKAEDGQEVR